MNYPLSDIQLSRRLERCEASANAAMVESRARLQPETGAEWIDVNGTYAMFDGVGSPLTQTFGFGVFVAPSEEDLARLEEFFAARGASVFHEVSPMAPPETLEVLARRDYRPVEMTSILYQPIEPRQSDSRIVTRRIAAGEEELWSATAAEGWKSESPDLAGFIYDMGRVLAAARGTHAFLAELDGRPIAAGAVTIHEGIALLAGASTITSERRQGAQKALLEARLRFAAEQGCDLAMMGAAPGSASQRNAQRQGFRIAYTRVKWGRALRAPVAESLSL